jgi:Flp pilus assembly protein TadG
MVEFALILPWYIFLFVGAFDYGFFSYGLIATQSAARVAAMYCSASSSRAANCTNDITCTYVLDQLRNMPNVGTATQTCTGAPVVLSTSMVSGAGSPDGNNAASVTVTYTTPQLIPIPGLLPGRVTIARTATMKALT